MTKLNSGAKDVECEKMKPLHQVECDGILTAIRMARVYTLFFDNGEYLLYIWKGVWGPLVLLSASSHTI